MAHIGRRYPVAFRRDWNKNSDISNPNAFPLHWRVTLHSGVTPTYAVDGAVFVLGPDVFQPPDELRWFSATQSIGGFNWQLVALLHWFNLPNTIFTTTWELLRSDRGLVAAWKPGPPSYDNPFGVVSGFAQTTFNDFAVFPRNSFFYNSTTNPAGH